jgi:C1A family cysteine protease
MSLLNNSKKKIKTDSTKVTLSNDVDWRRENIITKVEFQGNCGSCYSFASVGATEAAYALETKLPPPVLSKKEMVDCGASTGLYLKGCGGGVLESAYKYLQSYGVCLASEYPYEEKVGKCMSYKYPRAVKISGYSMLDDITQDGFLSMVSKKPTSIAIEMKPRWKLYRGGIVDVKGPCGFFFNHAILAVGYNLKKENGAPGYLILKNSYGEEWGVDGYMYYKLGIGYMGMCAIINSNNSQPII